MSDENQADDTAKPFWQSRTIIGAVVALVALFAGFKNVKIDTANLTDILWHVAGLIGSALAIWGRFQATQPIKFLGATTPGGAFNPKAEVKKATPISTPPDSSQSGRADLDALLLVGMFFLLIGMVLYSFPAQSAPSGHVSTQFLSEFPVPAEIGGKPVSEWMQVVTVEDKRPFFVRLWSSLKATPTLAWVQGSNGANGISLTKIEISGGADF